MRFSFCHCIIDQSSHQESFLRIREDVRVVLSSGYNEQEVTRRFAGRGLAGFVQKPYELATLRRTLHDVLDQGDARLTDDTA